MIEDSNIKNHAIDRIPIEARKGLYCYKFSFKDKILIGLCPLLTEKLRLILKEFEESGFKVIIKSTSSGIYAYIYVVFYWGLNDTEYLDLLDKKDRFFENTENLYYTLK